MKKSQMIRKMMKVLKTWEDCKLEPKLAHQLLDLLEANGMLPPDQRAHLPPPESVVNEWENEK